MEPAAIQALMPLVVELMKTYGLSAIPLILSGLIWWRSEARSKAKDTVIESLKAKIEAAQERRLEEALQMMQVAKSGTETSQARSQSDVEFLNAFNLMASQLERMSDRLAELGGSPPQSSLPRRRRP